MRINDLTDEIRNINEANGWNITTKENWQDTYKVPAILALVHSEVSEALEDFRHDRQDEFLEEMGDVIIRVLDCVGAFTDDMEAIILAKLEKNKTRGYRHGNKRV